MKNNRILREIFWKSIKQKLDKVAELLIRQRRKKTKTADFLRKHGGRTAEELALMPQLFYSKGAFDFSFNA